MTQQARALIEDAVKLVVAIFVFAGINLNPLNLGFYGGEAVKVLIEALLAAAIVVLIVDVLLGPPRISIEWSPPNGDPPPSGKPAIGPGRETWRVLFKVSETSWLQKRLSEIALTRNLEISVSFRPTDTLVVTVDSVTPIGSAVAHGTSKVVFSNVSLGPGGNVEAQIAMRRHASSLSSQSTPISMDVDVCWSPRLMRSRCTFIRIDPGVSGFTLRGN